MSNVEVKLDRGVFHCEIVIHPDSDRVRIVTAIKVSFRNFISKIRKS